MTITGPRRDRDRTRLTVDSRILVFRSIEGDGWDDSRRTQPRTAAERLVMTLEAVIPAAGQGVRMGAADPKQFLDLNGQPILARTIAALLAAPMVAGVVVVVPPAKAAATRERLAPHIPAAGSVRWVDGGRERQDSVANGLQALAPDCRWVVIHDGVRPFVSPALLARTWEAARETGAAVCAVPSNDTVKRVRRGAVVETLPREEIWLVQTPQVFRKDILLEAHEKCRKGGWQVTDDASLVERLGISVRVAPGEAVNRKITTPEDLDWARWVADRTDRSN